MKTTVTHITSNIKEVVQGLLNPVSLEIGARIASQAKLLAPVDEGQLRNSLSVSTKYKTKLLNDGPGEKAPRLSKEGLNDYEAYVGSNSDHAIFQEFGTIKAVAQPFLRPAEELITQGGEPAEVMQKYSREAMEKELELRKEERKLNG